MLIAFFILAQVVGLWLINKESSVSVDPATNKTMVTFADTAVGARPETTGSGSLLYVLIAVFIGTMLVLLIVKFGKVNIWKTWFFFAVWMAMSVSIGALVKSSMWFPYDIAIALALILAFWKIFRPNILIHNLTEILMYSGIALIIAPIFDVFWAIALLVVISLYDMYAVWKSKHMVKMAQFQTKSNVFAGLMIPYKQENKKLRILSSDEYTSATKTKKKAGSSDNGPKTAILGGGDIAFPLIFSGAVMNGLLLTGLSKSAAFLQANIITLTTAIALMLLFVYAKKGKFYPAMPFVTAGCLVGWAIVLII
jgi:presenilin-like A22 family membrane protease